MKVSNGYRIFFGILICLAFLAGCSTMPNHKCVTGEAVTGGDIVINSAFE